MTKKKNCSVQYSLDSWRVWNLIFIEHSHSRIFIFLWNFFSRFFSWWFSNKKSKNATFMQFMLNFWRWFLYQFTRSFDSKFKWKFTNENDKKCNNDIERKFRCSILELKSVIHSLEYFLIWIYYCIFFCVRIPKLFIQSEMDLFSHLRSE